MIKNQKQPEPHFSHSTAFMLSPKDFPGSSKGTPTVSSESWGYGQGALRIQRGKSHMGNRSKEGPPSPFTENNRLRHHGMHHFCPRKAVPAPLFQPSKEENPQNQVFLGSPHPSAAFLVRLSPPSAPHIPRL